MLHHVFPIVGAGYKHRTFGWPEGCARLIAVSINHRVEFFNVSRFNYSFSGLLKINTILNPQLQLLRNRWPSALSRTAEHTVQFDHGFTTRFCTL